MRYTIDNGEKKPVYLQLYEQIREDIETGVFEKGSKLPSKRMLAEELGVSVITTEHTYALLCEEGYIEARQRSGYFVLYARDDFSGRTTAGVLLNPVLLNAPHKKSEFPYSVFAKTIRRVLTDYGEGIFLKSPSGGCTELKTAISAYLLRSSGMRVSPEQIVIGAGAEYLYGLAAQLVGMERIVAIEAPSYKKIREVYRAHGIVCDPLPLGQDGIASEALARTQASVLHVTPFNSFPSGITASAMKRREYIRWAKQRNGYIIEDNYDSELTVSTKNETTLFSMTKDDNVIYLNTFSHTVAPSVRTGYMVLPPPLLARFLKHLSFYSCTVPTLEQYTLAYLIQGGDFERHINRVRREKRKQEKP